MRFVSPVMGGGRYASEDIEINGTHLPAGTQLMVSTNPGCSSRSATRGDPALQTIHGSDANPQRHGRSGRVEDHMQFAGSAHHAAPHMGRRVGGVQAYVGEFVEDGVERPSHLEAG
jgi:cytochrome P450